MRPSGNAGFDAMTFRVERNLPGEFFNKTRAFRPGPDQAHLSAQHVQQLRQLIDAELADQRSPSGHTGIPLRGPLRRAILFGISTHAAELDDKEWPPVEAH